VSRVGSVQIRNRATVGGNLCSALPSADSAGPLLAINALVEIFGPEGKREVPLDKFFTGVKKTVLKKGEILTRIFVPPYGPNCGGAYIKFTRREAMDLALLGVAVFLETEADQKTCREARISLATAAPTPMRAYQAEAVLKGQSLGTALFNQAAAAVLNEATPRSSWRASEEFRRRLIKYLVPRAGMLAWERLKKAVVEYPLEVK
jgi:CO/xanthine dehydrogenase FAD-binding subunit